jgi:hypothetical protein
LINEVKTASDVMDDITGNIASRFEELRLKLGEFLLTELPHGGRTDL